ncbi:MAG: PAQR family membrane homeostasis protein TrhA [Acidimicrobiales bacterium]
MSGAGPVEPVGAGPTGGRGGSTAGPGPGRPKPVMRGWLHLGGLVAMLVAGPLLIARAPDAPATAFLVVYVLSLVALFGVSASFHLVHWSPPARRRMRRADHSTIFVAIAGTYTAVGGLALTGWSRVLILALVWTGAVGGIVLRQLWLDAPKWAVAVPYVVVGWSAVVVLPQLVRSLGGVGFGLLLAGGACYTVGALVYALRRPDPFPTVFGYHEVFHTLTVVGAALHYAVILAYALPRA